MKRGVGYSSALIEYLDGDGDAVEYVQSHLDDRAVAPPLVLFEVYQGEPLAARDAYIAGTAKALDERLAVADSDFEVEGVTDVLGVDFL